MQEIMNFEGGGYEPVMLVGPVPQRRAAVGRKVLAGAAAAAMGLAVVALVVYSADPNQGAASSMSVHSSCVGSSCGTGAGGIGGEMHFGSVLRSPRGRSRLCVRRCTEVLPRDTGLI